MDAIDRVIGDALQIELRINIVEFGRAEQAVKWPPCKEDVSDHFEVAFVLGSRPSPRYRTDLRPVSVSRRAT